jgi:hypothetical protein
MSDTRQATMAAEGKSCDPPQSTRRTRRHRHEGSTVMRTYLALAALTLSLGSLAACGSDDQKSSSHASATDTYCKELKSDKAYFDTLGGSSPDVSKFDDAFARMHSLAGKAPSPVKDDWKTLDGALTSITDALKDAGISFADIAKMQQGQIPKGTDPQKIAALAPKLQAMSSAKVEAASTAIKKHAQSTCHVKLGSTS